MIFIIKYKILMLDKDKLENLIIKKLNNEQNFF